MCVSVREYGSESHGLILELVDLSLRGLRAREQYRTVGTQDDGRYLYSGGRGRTIQAHILVTRPGHFRAGVKYEHQKQRCTDEVR